MKEMELEEIEFDPHPIKDCTKHRFERLLYIVRIEDYGYAVHDARVKKCFKCKLVMAEED